MVDTHVPVAPPQTDSLPSSRPIIVAIAGDPAIDVFQEEIRHHNIASDDSPPANWRRVPGYIWHEHGGGVLLLTRMLKASLNASPGNADQPVEFFCPKIPVDMANLRPKLVQSLAEIRRDPPGKDEKASDAWRVKRFHGFAGPLDRPEAETAGVGQADGLRHLLYPESPNSIPFADILVIDDAGNGFRSNTEDWPKWLAPNANLAVGTLILKINTPLPDDRTLSDSRPWNLWRRLQDISAERRLVIVNGYDLRRDNADISRRLSWERTLHDIRVRADSDPVLMTLRAFGDVVVRLGIEGTVLIERKRRSGSNRVFLLCEPGAIEDDWDEDHERYMPGSTSAFTAGLVAALLDQKRRSAEVSGRSRPLLQSIQSGMNTAVRFVKNGFFLSKGHLDTPLDLVFAPSPPLEPDPDSPLVKRAPGLLYNDERPRSVFTRRIGSAAGLETLKPIWSSVEDRIADEAERPARIVREGLSFINAIPHARFGALTTADYAEIEGYRSIANLFRKYMRGSAHDKPLSIAVFGPPGSGKSFGIKSIAKLLGSRGNDTEIEIAEFNVAQWQGPQDLIGALHVARDIRLTDRLPLIFFDEFDSSWGSAELGWLKSFLAPMQDGKFKDGDRLHSIGKALFVFAGGTADRFSEFTTRWTQAAVGESGKAETAPIKTGEDRFKTAKGPDFVSRLSGYVDVKSINDTKPGTPDLATQLRRAILLRSKLEDWHPGLLNHKGHLSIDPSVLKALLCVEKYNHGVRSMEAILRMSSLPHDAPHFPRSALPGDDQLGLHLNKEDVRKLLSEPTRR